MPAFQKNRLDLSKAVFIFILTVFNYLADETWTDRRPNFLASEQLGTQISTFLPLILPPVSDTK
jgi:hypothetical protein